MLNNSHIAGKKNITLLEEVWGDLCVEITWGVFNTNFN